MTPRQTKVLNALQEAGALSYQEVSMKTDLGYTTTYRLLLSLCKLGCVRQQETAGKPLFRAVPAGFGQCEAVVQRAIRKRPALHNIFWQGAQQ